MKKHFVGNVSVRALLRDQNTNEVLVTRDSKDNLYEIPGGRLDENESFDENLKREIKEELGVDIDVNSINYLYSDQNIHGRDGTLQAFIVFIININSKDSINIELSDEVTEYKWVNNNNYQDLSYFDCVQKALDKYFEKV